MSSIALPFFEILILTSYKFGEALSHNFGLFIYKVFFKSMLLSLSISALFNSEEAMLVPAILSII